MADSGVPVYIEKKWKGESKDCDCGGVDAGLWERLAASEPDEVFVKGDDDTPTVWRVRDYVCKEEREWEGGAMVEEPILKRLRGCEHIVQVVWSETREDPRGNPHTERTRVSRLVFDYYPLGNAISYVRKHGIPPEKVLWRWMGDIARALATAHARNILHSDVRPWNMLVCNDGLDLVLADFDVGHVLSSPDATVRPRCGLPIDFIPPEKASEGRLGTKGDTWMLGVSFAMLATPVLPGKLQVHWRSNLTRRGDAMPILEVLRPCVSASMFTLIETCLRSATERPSAAEIVALCSAE
jgi:serine/threonine protein kinase